ncbi:MAG: hypothetical protein ABSF95_05925 [Verrucomicrobiota bacterium]
MKRRAEQFLSEWRGGPGRKPLVLGGARQVGKTYLVENWVAVDGGSSPAGPGFPAPEQAKAKAMPSDDALGLEEEQGLLSPWPEAQQANPKQSIGGAEFGFAGLPFEHGELMSERQILKREPGMGLEAGKQGA